jgi:TldD protein
LQSPAIEAARLFTELEPANSQKILRDALGSADDGELFLEYRQSESLVYDDGKLKSAAYDTTQGFGLRAVAGETTAYAHSSEISEPALKRAAETVRAAAQGKGGTLALPPQMTNRKLYSDINPIEEMDFAAKVKLLREADAFARSLDGRVRQVSISLAGEWQLVEILRPDGFIARDIRPLVRFNVTVVTGEGSRQESGTYGMGGRSAYSSFLSEEQWQGAVQEALRQSLIALSSVAAPAGEMDVVLGPGWPGILLHEAIGHGLEGDFNRKKTSAFCGLLGQRIAAPGITVIDDGILAGYMQDRLNARLMGAAPTGNGRRQSFAHSPMPRMTNTIMLPGQHEPEEILASVKQGLYAVNFGGGQVDITSGKFVFSCTEAYKIENGKIGAAVKGAMLIGSGADALTRISLVGNDTKLDSGIGTCGKQGQGVPVGVGQPTIRIDKITVGGTAA